MLDTESFHPDFVFLMSHDGYFVAFFLQAKAQRNVRLNVSTRSDGKANEVLLLNVVLVARWNVDRAGDVGEQFGGDGASRAAFEDLGDRGELFGGGGGYG